MYIHTPSGQRVPMWYWDEKSGTWYSFEQTGSYYTFKWSYKKIDLTSKETDYGINGQ